MGYQNKEHVCKEARSACCSSPCSQYQSRVHFCEQIFEFNQAGYPTAQASFDGQRNARIVLEIKKVMEEWQKICDSKVMAADGNRIKFDISKPNSWSTAYFERRLLMCRYLAMVAELSKSFDDNPKRNDFEWKKANVSKTLVFKVLARMRRVRNIIAHDVYKVVMTSQLDGDLVDCYQKVEQFETFLEFIKQQ